MRTLVLFILFILFLPPLLSQKISKNIQNLDTKKSPLLKNNKINTNLQDIRVLVNNKLNFKDWAFQELPKVVIKPTKYSTIFELKGLKQKGILHLIECEWVDFIDLPNRQAIEERIIGDHDLSANKITPVHNDFPQITGEGLVVSVKERLFDTTDIDFHGRILFLSDNSEQTTLHATTMATLIAGAGNSAPEGKGVAWKAGLTSSSFNDLLPDDGDMLLSENISVQNHSYGVDQIENYYGIEAQQYDKHCFTYPTIMHVFSSGNIGSNASNTGLYTGIKGFANLSGQFKMSKNTISVGAVDLNGDIAALSSKGPSYDGRVKPELVAYGPSGTSDAAALTSGVCLLVQQVYKNQYSELPPTSLVKATLINSADDIGRKGIDFESGYGYLDAFGAIKTIVENHFITSSVEKGETQVYNITIPENIHELKVTIVWHDPEAEINSATALVNDLDIELLHPSSGMIYHPWVLSHYPLIDSLTRLPHRKKDSINNIEQITLSMPEAGNYEIHVDGQNITSSSQSYSIAYEYETGFNWIYPLQSSKLKPGKKLSIRWQWRQPDALGNLEYQIVGSDTWNLIDSNIELTQSIYEWMTPDTSTSIVLKINTADSEFLSDTIVLSRPIKVKVGLNCDDEALLFWESQSEAEEYKVYQLREKFLEPFLTTTDTFILLNSNEKQSLFYSVAPVVDGISGTKGHTINYTTQGVVCYFVSFLPKSFVTDTVVLNLKLASNYRLNSASIERLSNNEFITLQTISPVTDLQMTFEDFTAKPNRNFYRIKLERDDLKLIYSNQEDVFFKPERKLFVFPNPVSPNQTINIIDGGESAAEIKLIDNSGKIVYTYYSDPATIKSFPLKNINDGIYFLEVLSEDGCKTKQKIVVLKLK